jgi:hypothetical protein
VLKNRLIKLENKLSQKSHWSGVAFINKQTGIMKIPTLGFIGTEEEGRRKLDSMDADVVIIIDDIMQD